MYVILVYDINVKRVGKVLKISRRYLTWVQNSVLEGELTEATFRSFLAELRQVIDEDEDSLLFYILKSQYFLERKSIGIEKGEDEWVY